MRKNYKKIRCIILSLIMSITLVNSSLFLTNSYAATDLSQEIVESTTNAGKVISKSLNVRTGPSTKNEAIGKLYKNDTFEILEQSGNWYKINYNENHAYISANSKYVSTFVKYSYKVLANGLTISGVNVRTGPSSKYSKVGYLVKGTKIDIVKQASSGWYKIKYDNSYGYLSNKYVQLDSDEDNSIIEDDNNLPVIKQGQTTSSLNVREGNSTSYNILGKLSKGAKIDIVETMPNGWYKIKYNGDYGYVSGVYVRAILDKFLFVGDSYTYLLKDTINENTTGAIVKAKSGCVPSYWLSNFDQMPSSSKVKGVCVLLGVNGMNSREYDTTVKDLKLLIDKLSNKYSNKVVYVQKVFPLGRNYSITVINRISKFNKEIEAYCSTISNVKFIDTTDGFVDDDGYLKYADSEGIHIVYSKFTKFFNNIGKAILNEL